MPARVRRDGWLVAALALLLRVGVALWGWSLPPTADGSYYHVIAGRIADGHGYTWLWPDGAVTYAAHYPVGYPALIAPAYALFGATPGVAMLVNALLGALACLAVHRLLEHRGRGVALIGAAATALHPGLWAYTPALMTEGVTAALWAAAAWAAQAARARPGWRAVLVGLLVGAATLVRPQSLLLAPVLGAGMGKGWRRAAAALGVMAIALACCLPWTLRNCARMDRCALVSVNGGWNLLIGTQPEGAGGWSEIRVPEGCRAVFDEAGKDRCFEEAARQRIAADVGGWLALAPRKLAATFDYCGAPGWYLHAADPAAFPYRAKEVLGVVETTYERLVLLLAIAAAWSAGGTRGRPSARSVVGERSSPRSGTPGTQGRVRGLVALVGAAFAVQVHATLAYAALALLLGWRARRTVPALAALAAIVLVGGIHAVFFGGGRYQLPMWPLLCAVAAPGLARAWRLRRTLARWRRIRRLRGARAAG